MFPVLLEGVACILDASFQPGPMNGTDFDAASGRRFEPFTLPCGDEDALKGGSEDSDEGRLDVRLIGVAISLAMRRTNHLSIQQQPALSTSLIPL